MHKGFKKTHTQIYIQRIYIIYGCRQTQALSLPWGIRTGLTLLALSGTKCVWFGCPYGATIAPVTNGLNTWCVKDPPASDAAPAYIHGGECCHRVRARDPRLRLPLIPCKK